MGAWMLPVHWLPQWRGHEFITSAARLAWAAAVLTLHAAWGKLRTRNMLGGPQRDRGWQAVGHGTSAKPDRSACRSAFRRSSKFCGNIARPPRTMCDRRQANDLTVCICWPWQRGRRTVGQQRPSLAEEVSPITVAQARRCCFAPIPQTAQHTALTLLPTVVGHAIGRGTHRARSDNADKIV